MGTSGEVRGSFVDGGQVGDALVGRAREIQRVDDLTRAAQAGEGGALVLRGEAGIGKSALLDRARRSASGFRVVAVSGSEYEAELPFAALHQLCLPVLGHLDELPEPQRDALRVAFGLTTGTPDLFRIGLAALGLFAAAARERPLLCLVDDAQWLDAASSRALAFVARRVAAEPVALVLAVRLPCAAGELDDLPGLAVGGLSDAEARSLLAAQSHETLDEQVRDRIVAEARGNPLALLALPRAGGFAPPDTSPVPSRVERGFREALTGLPDDARLLLTVASADPTGDPGLLWPAARHLGLDVATVSAAAAGTGLVELGTRVRFFHPLARAAVYEAAGADERRAAHRALAAVTDPVVDPDRRAWHRAQAEAGPDDDVAAELERSASRARSRGGVVAAAAFLERAAELSLDAGLRTGRTLAAVGALLDAGAVDRAAELLAAVDGAGGDGAGGEGAGGDGAGSDTAGTDNIQLAEADLLRGRIAFVQPGDSNGPLFMLRAARRLAASDPERSRESYLEALEMAQLVGRGTGMTDRVLAAALEADQLETDHLETDQHAPAGTASRAPDVLDALTVLASRGHRAAVPLIRDVLAGADGATWTRHPALAITLAAELWDPHTHATILEWLMKTGRESGSPLVLRLGLAQAASNAALTGDLDGALAAVAEEAAIADATGGTSVMYHRLQLAAMRGRRQEAEQLFEAAVATAAAQGEGQLVANVHWAEAVLNNGLGDYPAALAAARKAVDLDDLFIAGFSLPELVEAAVRCGERAAAVGALAALTERTEASATPTGLGIAAYARGLVTGAEDDYREAVEHLADSPLLPYRARAHLLYGEWLRRAGRRRDCRPHLRTAHELLSGAGIEAFARRAADELRATGETARSRSGHTRDQLTMQELHIARLVATGATSNEVAGRLFISPRTVDAHLRNIYRKLGISSRRQLRDLPDLRPAAGVIT
ncbi:AAA family ATPase [Promicromonospora sukumoe]|uniref:DNA-binding CsgD family transcriptional regulator n=1 Tax=Promicromonospora sukumoe TaxID=88382 RepID=A0A7W3JA12_9MICO|nr:LuxR family transcriptional regulator [Promicromonospora sukumoe]MBA8809030.1 DNA-binding CsgD family transcriptional regulator [Promicromonospora sukumoe]